MKHTIHFCEKQIFGKMRLWFREPDPDYVCAELFMFGWTSSGKNHYGRHFHKGHDHIRVTDKELVCLQTGFSTKANEGAVKRLTHYLKEQEYLSAYG